VRLTASDTPDFPDHGSHLVEGRLVVVTDCPIAAAESWFERPDLALSRIPGLRSGRALRDDGSFASLRARAESFAWDATLQARADAFANEAMVGWVEEVHKGLAGLRGATATLGSTGPIGRLLDAEFGLSWGLNRLVEVQRGLPLQPPPSGGRWSADWFARGEQAVGVDSEWAHLRRIAFGMGKTAGAAEGPTDAIPTLEHRVTAGLWFFVATAELLADVWQSPAEALINHASDLVRRSGLPMP